jgi:hypothetical protein
VTGDALTLSGADEAAAALAEIGASQTEVDRALTDHGALVVNTATPLAPRKTGALVAAMSTTYTPSAGLVVSAGTQLAPHAYTMHATALGYANGGMTFAVGSHSRKGSTVTAYRAKRRIPNRPYLTQAWDQELPKLREAVESALARMIGG